MRTDYTFDQVVDCNHAFVHCKDGTTEWSVKANKERLHDIMLIASDKANFFFRMWREILDEYHKRDVELDKEKIYSADEIEEAKDWHKHSFTAASEMEWHNRTVRDKRSHLSGFFNAGSWAYDNYVKYRNLAEKAHNGMKVM